MNPGGLIRSAKERNAFALESLEACLASSRSCGYESGLGRHHGALLKLCTSYRSNDWQQCARDWRASLGDAINGRNEESTELCKCIK